MFQGKRKKELREEKGLLQRKQAAELEIDSPKYSNIERGERRAKRAQVIKLADLLETDKNALLTLWLAGQINEIVKDESTALKAIEIVKEHLNKQNKR